PAAPRIHKTAPTTTRSTPIDHKTGMPASRPMRRRTTPMVIIHFSFVVRLCARQHWLFWWDRYPRAPIENRLVTNSVHAASTFAGGRERADYGLAPLARGSRG